MVDHYGQQDKPSLVLALSKGVFGRPIAQQVAPVELSEVTVCSSFRMEYLLIMVVFVNFLNIGFVSVQLQRGKSYKGKSHKSTLLQTGEGAHSDFRQLHRCHLLSYRFAEHTFGKSKDRRRFLLLT